MLTIKRNLIVCLLLLFIIGALVLLTLNSSILSKWQSYVKPPIFHKTEPALKFYPINKEIQFIRGNSSFSLEKEKGNSYKIIVETSSETSIPTFLRQDVSLIYSNGVLQEKVYSSKENASQVEQNVTLQGEGSTRYDMITFHHAEIHDQNGNITSQQSTSVDQVYILSSPFSPSTLFRAAKTNTQKQWQRILDQAIAEQWNYQLTYLLQFFNLDSTTYEIIPFTELANYQDHPFNHYSVEKTQQIIGGIWEGIYRHYVLGIANSSQTIIDSKGSTIPILLLAKDGSHLHILFRTKTGQEVQLIQIIKP